MYTCSGGFAVGEGESLSLFMMRGIKSHRLVARKSYNRITFSGRQAVGDIIILGLSCQAAHVQALSHGGPGTLYVNTTGRTEHKPL